MTADERGHLSDLEIAILVTGGGSRALRQTLSEHLNECGDCRALVAESACAQHGGDESEAGPARTQGILDAMAAAAPEPGGPDARPLRLRLLPGNEDEILALAAEPASSQPLRTLFSPDGSIVVCIERAGRRACLRARIARQGFAQRGTMWLVFRDTGLSFRIAPDAAIDLPGLTAKQLAAETIEIEFRT
jgi:hypothetical protein